ncbi:hypothetical protein ASG70_06870 [Phycicoccus sp. Soil748]|nr:hypothetical protein ASG70_06870 [Phycicoccus sp. Soil748]
MEAGAVHVTVARPSPAVATTFVGASGGEAGPPGVTAALGALGRDRPTEFTARTVKVYAVPFASPVKSVDVVVPSTGNVVLPGWLATM